MKITDTEGTDDVEQKDKVLIKALKELASDTEGASSDFFERTIAAADQQPLFPQELAQNPKNDSLSSSSFSHSLMSLWGQIREMFAPRLLMPALVPACLLLLVLWPSMRQMQNTLAGLQSTAESNELLLLMKAAKNENTQLRQEVSTLRANLKAQEEKSERDLQVQKDNIRARWRFDSGDYTGAKMLYLENAKRDAGQADTYYINAALAAWYGCEYAEAQDMLEQRLSHQTSKSRLYLGMVYQSMGRPSDAQQHYRHIAQASDVMEDKEIAWFNLATVYAARFKQEPEAHILQEALASLEKSLEIAAALSSDQWTTRRDAIQAALELRPAQVSSQCGDGYSVVSDLTPLATQQPFIDWWTKLQKIVNESRA